MTGRGRRARGGVFEPHVRLRLPGQHAGGSGTGRCKAQNVGFVGGRETGRHALMKLRRLPGRGNRAEKQAERRRREVAVHAGLIP